MRRIKFEQQLTPRQYQKYMKEDMHTAFLEKGLFGVQEVTLPRNTITLMKGYLNNSTKNNMEVRKNLKNVSK